jgi:glycosyltransferase involved in cell wall biosynthesis
VITPSFNQGTFLEKTIQSVLCQEYSDLEFIIVDGGSTDGSVGIIKKYEVGISYWVSEPDNGQSHAINKGFKKSTGTILCWLNSDDYLLPGALHLMARMYHDNPESDVFVGAGQFVDAHERVLSTEIPPATLNIKTLLDWHEGGRIMQASCFFTRSAWQSCGPLDMCLHYAMDLDLWLKFAARFMFACTEQIVSSARLHPDAKTTENANLALVDSCLVLLKHGGESQARTCLENMAARLTWNEYYVGLITDSKLFRLLAPMARYFFGSDMKWKEFSSPNRFKNGG